MYPETGTPEEAAGRILLRPESYRVFAAVAGGDRESGLGDIARTTTLGRQELRGRIAELEELDVLSVRGGMWGIPPRSSRVTLTDLGRAVADVIRDPGRRPEIDEHLRYVGGDPYGAMVITNALRVGASGERFLRRITGYSPYRLADKIGELRERGLVFEWRTRHRPFGVQRWTALTGDGLVCDELAQHVYKAAGRGENEALTTLDVWGRGAQRG